MPRPHRVGVRVHERFVRWAVPVVGGGSGAQQTFAGVSLRGGPAPPDTLLGFETASPSPLRPFEETGGDRRSPCVGGWRVVAPLWWWGVVFDLWIVVASI